MYDLGGFLLLFLNYLIQAEMCFRKSIKINHARKQSTCFGIPMIYMFRAFLSLLQCYVFTSLSLVYLHSSSIVECLLNQSNITNCAVADYFYMS